MIGSNINKVLFFALILLLRIGPCYAQEPVITPKTGHLNFPLDNTGNLTLTPADIATVTPDATNPNPTVIIRPSVFDCDTRGSQQVVVTASDAPPPVTFFQPTGIAADAAGDFYITDAGNHKIRKIAANGNVTDFAGSGNIGVADGLGAAASFDTPQGITIDAAGNLFVTDSKAGLIRKITPAALVTTIAGTAYSTSNDEGTGFGVSFDEPYGITIDGQGNMYVADATANRIRKVTPNGYISTFAGSGTRGYVDGSASHAEFTVPGGVAIDATGNLYVADTYNERIRKITPAGVVSTVAGDGIASLLDGTGTSANFNMPYNLIVGANGNIYVADTQSNAIRKIDPTGKVTTIAGNGAAGDINGISYTNMPILSEFNSPEGLAFDASGNLYVGDIDNNRIREITIGADYTVSSFAGSGDQGDTNGNINPGDFAVAAATVTVNIETTLTILTKYNDVQLGQCVTTMPDFVTANPPQTFDNCNNNIPAHQIPKPGTPLTSNATIPVLIIVEDATGKLDTATFNAYTTNVPPVPAVSIAPLSAGAVCAGSPVSFTATTTNAVTPSYQWAVNGNNQGSNSPSFTAVCANGDTVTCTITSATCSLQATSPAYTVNVNPKPGISFVGGPSIRSGSSVHLNPLITGDIKSYTWSPATGLSNDTIANPVASPTKTTTYQLNAISATGCDSTAAITVTVINNISIPNTFTPNNDGINDQWDIPDLAVYPNCNVDVFNRYGSLVYHSIGYPKAWNGTYNRSPLPVGTYYYVIDLKNGTPKMAGPVTILK